MTGAIGYPAKSEVVQGWLTSQGGAGHGRLSRGWTEYAARSIAGRNGWSVSGRIDDGLARMGGAVGSESRSSGGARAGDSRGVFARGGSADRGPDGRGDESTGVRRSL